MDVLRACVAFVAVAERGSFTVGAAAVGMAQPVASRRIAALEEHLGGRLIDRSSRRATLTPFGRDLLPSVQRLVELADDLQHDARRAALRPLQVAVPDIWSTAVAARLTATAQRRGARLDLVAAPPGERAEMLRTRQVRAALTAVAPARATWTQPLGLAAAQPSPAARTHLETLRSGRSAGASPRVRVWLLPEDDVPHVRDPLTRLRDALGLAPTQLAVAAGTAAAAAEVLTSADLLLCSAGQARELGLCWRPVAELGLARGYDLQVAADPDADGLSERLSPVFAGALRSPDDAADQR